MHGSKSKNKFLLSTVHWLVLSQLSTYSGVSLAADKNMDHSIRYLDPSIVNITVNEDHCFNAAPNALLEISPNNTNKIQRLYAIRQIFNKDEQRQAYAKSIEDQMRDHQFVATRFCQGFVSLSNIKVPFPKGNAITDANDGMLLIDEARHGMATILSQLKEMNALAVTAANGTNGSVDLSHLNDEFQSHLNKIDTIATQTQFNSIALLDGTHTHFNIPIQGGHAHQSLNLINATIGSAGLNIESLELTSMVNALTAIGEVQVAMNAMMSDLTEVIKNATQLKDDIKSNQTLTVIDIRTDKFLVKKTTLSTVASK